MRGHGKEIETITEEKIFKQFKEILYEVAPLKVIEEITMQTSLIEDFAFDSIDIMGTLLKIQERFLKDSSILEMDSFLNETFSNEKRFTVQMICQQIIIIIQKEKASNE
jgi:acyl carrier protein